MNYHLTAIKTLGRRRVFESLIDPGFYISLSIGLLCALFLVVSFIRSVDSSGFDYARNDFYRFLAEGSASIFGERLFSWMMAKGPVLPAFYAALAPVAIYLPIASIYRFSAEKRAGMVELFISGPMDAASYCLASLGRDLLLMCGTLIIVLAFLVLGASLYNLALPSTLPLHVFQAFLTTASLYSYSLLVVVCTDHASSALAVGFLIFSACTAILISEYSIVDGYMRTRAVVAGALGFFSPLFYWSVGIGGQAAGNGIIIVAGTLGQITLCTVVAIGSSVVLTRRGVRG